MSTPVNETTIVAPVVTPEEQASRMGDSFGTSRRRVEDGRLLQGQGEFTDDFSMAHQGYAHFVRSPYAHAKILSIDAGNAEALDGVYAVLTGPQAKDMCTDTPFFQIAPEPAGKLTEWPMAVDKVRYHGDAIAVVLAESRGIAEDAAELVEVEYAPLPHVTDAVKAAEADAPVLHEECGTNVSWHGVYEYGDIDWALENADHVVKIDRLHFHRYSAAPLECNAAVVNWDPGSGMIDVRSNNQMPMFASMVISQTLGVKSNQFHFKSMDIGGAFGAKICSYPQIASLALLSKKAGRPAKWTEWRSDNMLSSGQANERHFLDIEVPVLEDGTILGFKARAFDDAGAYLHYEPLGSVIWSQVVPGCYKLKHVNMDFTQTMTNKCPTSPVRGYSRLQHLWFLERVIDIVAKELDFDPVEIRKKNYVQPEDYPYVTPNECVYDSGDLPRSLDMVLDLIDIDKWRERQKELGTGSGKRIGIGIGSTLDSGSNNFGQAQIINPELPFSGNGEAALAKLDLFGEINIDMGTTPQGQGHETTAGQVVADILKVSPDDVHVSIGFDQANNAFVGFSGTYASQFAVTGIGAVIGATENLKDEMTTLAAYALGAEKDEIEFENGECYVRGDRERAIPFIGIANMAYSNNAGAPPEIQNIGLNCRYVYVPPHEVPDVEKKTGNLTLTYASQIHAAVIEIDEETGRIKILDYAAVDDCGRALNPMIVQGQVMGAAAQGIGAALYEAIEFDEDGQQIQSSFYEYHTITAPDMPMIKYSDIESPSPFTPNGAKGMGEGGGAPLSTISAAVQDALGKTDAIVSDSNASSARVYDLLTSGERNAPRGVQVEGR